jgi:hypothetical protein
MDDQLICGFYILDGVACIEEMQGVGEGTSFKAMSSGELVGQKSYQQTHASSNLDRNTDEDQLDSENNNKIIAPGIYKAIVVVAL